jgi:hypothetical protein
MTFLYQVFTGSSLMLISLIATALHATRAVEKRRLNFDDCSTTFLLSVDND